MMKSSISVLCRQIFLSCAVGLLSLLGFGVAEPLVAQSDALPFDLVVHADNPIDELTHEAVAKIFLKQADTWPDGRRAVVFTPATQPLRAAFAQAIYNRSESSINMYWQRQIFAGRETPPDILSEEEILLRIPQEPGAIAYVASGRPLIPGVKRIGIQGFSLSEPGDPFGADGLRSDFVEADDGATRGEPTLTERLRDYAGDPADDAQPSSGAALTIVAPTATPGVLWASFIDHGIWVSENSGDDWRRIESPPDPELRTLIFDPSDSDRIVAGGSQALYFTSNGGSSWYAVPEIGGVLSLSFSPAAGGDAFYIHTEEGLFRTFDSGTSLTRIEVPGGTPTAFDVHPESGRLYTVASNILYKSDDHGDSWEELQIFPAHETIRTIFVDARDGSEDVLWIPLRRVLLRGERGGRVWKVSLEASVRNLTIIDDTLFAVADRGVLEYQDDAETPEDAWKTVGFMRASVLVADPNVPELLYLGDLGGQIWRRAHAQARWVKVFNVRQAPAIGVGGELVEPTPPPPLPVAVQLLCDPQEGHVGAVAAHPRERGVVFAGTTRGVFRSDDDGRTFVPAGLGLEVADVHALAIDGKAPDTIWAGTHGAGVFVSRDGGASFSPVGGRGLELRRRPILALAVDPDIPQQIYAVSHGEIFTRDDEAGWRRLREVDRVGNFLHGNSRQKRERPPNGRVLAIDPSSTSKVTLAADDGSWYEADLGAGVLRPREGRLIHEAALRDGMICVCAEGGEQCIDPDALRAVRPRAPAIRDLAFSSNDGDDGVAWAATAFGLWRIDRGGEWTATSLSSNLSAVAVSRRGDLFAGGADGLWVSRDQGTTWRSWGVEEAVYSLDVEASISGTVYAGLSDDRLAVVRERSGKARTKIVRVPTPPDADEPIEKITLAGTDSALARRPDSPPEASETAWNLWHAIWATPAANPRLRALYAAELLGGAPAEHQKEVREALEESLADIVRQASRHGREEPLGFGFTPDGRYFWAEFQFDDGVRSHSEIRLYAPQMQALEKEGVVPERMHWRRLHDLDLEPQHLAPTWILQDPGRLVAWSPRGDLFATHAAPDTLHLRQIPTAIPERATSFPPRKVALDLDGARLIGRGGKPGVLSADGMRLALVREFTDVSEVRVFDLRRGVREPAASRLVWSVETDDSSRFTQVLFTRDGSRLLGVRADGEMHLWPVAADPAEHQEPVYSSGVSPRRVGLSPDGRWLFADMAGELLLWNLDRRLEPDEGFLDSPTTLTTTPRGFSKLLFRDDGDWLLGTHGSETRLWDLREAPRQAAVINSTRPMLFDRKGDLLLHERAAAKRWELDDDPTLRPQISGTRPEIGRDLFERLLRRGVGDTWSPDGRYAVQGDGAEICLWDLSEPTPRSLIARVARSGPIGMHDNEGDFRTTERILASWPSQAELSEMSDGALRAITCRLIGRTLSRDEWTFAMGDEEYRPFCPP